MTKTATDEARRDPPPKAETLPKEPRTPQEEKAERRAAEAKEAADARAEVDRDMTEADAPLLPYTERIVWAQGYNAARAALKESAQQRQADKPETPDNTLPQTPARPDQTLPPAAQPKK
jgi:hypothetical protein